MENTLFVVPSFSVMVDSLLSPWMGLGLLILFCLNIWWLFEREDTFLDTGDLLSFLGFEGCVSFILLFVLTFCTKKLRSSWAAGNLTRVDTFLAPIFYFAFPVWFIWRAFRDIWPNIFG